VFSKAFSLLTLFAKLMARQRTDPQISWFFWGKQYGRSSVSGRPQESSQRRDITDSSNCWKSLYEFHML